MTTILKKFNNEHQQAEANLYSALKKEYPIGSDVSWLKHGKTAQCGVVIDHSYTDRIKVKNTNTNKVLWVAIYNILMAMDK